MSIITVAFGQCGIHVTQDLFTTLYDDINTTVVRPNNEYTTEARKRWFSIRNSGLWSPRAILIDTDNKTTIDNKRFQFNRVLMKCVGGCGNNWANGYCRKSELFVGEIEDNLRRLFENDEISCVFSLFSASGGTGGGVGTKILRHLRDCFPEKRLLVGLILPYNAGEIAIQPYNTVLTLAKLYDVADGLFLFENDRLQNYFKHNNKNIDYQHLNALIAKQLAVVLQPIKGLFLSDLIDNLNVSSGRKLIQLKGGQIAVDEKFETIATWSGLIKEIARANRKFKSVTDVVVSRGVKQPEIDEIALLGMKNLRHYHQNRPFRNENRNLVVLSNSNSVELTLNSIIADAWKLFTHGAYLHHYLKYGIDEQYFLNAFEKLETVLYEYKNL